MDNIFVFDTQNPKKNAFAVSEAWIEIMNRKEPGRYQVKKAPTVVSIPKKKVVVVNNSEGKIRVEDAEYAMKNTVLTVTDNIKKEVVSLKPIKVSAPSKKRN